MADFSPIQTFSVTPTAGYHGTGSISLADMLENPEMSFAQIESNLRQNAVPLAISTWTFGFTSALTRRILRKPINTINQLIFTGQAAPLRGMGIRI
jgi:hypothetical protein